MTINKKNIFIIIYMNNFNLNDDFDFSTNISTLKKNDEDEELLELLKDLENRLDVIEYYNKKEQNKKIMKKNNINSLQLKTNKNIQKEPDKYKPNYKEYIILVIIFIILNNHITVGFIHNLPLLNKKPNPYPNLIIRILLFILMIYLYKRYLI